MRRLQVPTAAIVQSTEIIAQIIFLFKQPDPGLWIDF